MKPALFIGSSSEKLEVAYAMQTNLERDLEVTVWNQSVFHLSGTSVESILDVLNRADFGAFVFAPDDITRLRGTENLTVRDNVIFELGMFIGRLGRERSFIIVPQGQPSLHLPTDLLGLTPGSYEPNRADDNLVAALGPACSAIRSKVATLSSRWRAEERPQDNEKLDENDCLSLLESWMGSRPDGLNTQVLRFAEVDRELGLPSGASAKHLESAAKRWEYEVARRGANTILFRSRS